jgi:hypothetical protein
MTDYALVLTREYPGREWSLNGDDYAGLTIQDDGPKPTKKTLDDKWPKVQHDVKWDAVRAERDRRLGACDWTQVADAPVDPVAWAAYRQELRDIPQDFNDPDLVVWPEEP